MGNMSNTASYTVAARRGYNIWLTPCSLLTKWSIGKCTMQVLVLPSYPTSITLSALATFAAALPDVQMDIQYLLII